MAKTNIRSFRYSDEVAAILEGAKGKSLNEKFENLVLFCFWEENKIKKRIAQREEAFKALEERNRNSFDAMIKQKQERLHELEKEINEKIERLLEFDSLIEKKNEIVSAITKTVLLAMDYKDGMNAVLENKNESEEF